MKMVKPEMVEAPVGRGVTAIGKYYPVRKIPCPTIETILDIHEADSAGICTITSIVETAVT